MNWYLYYWYVREPLRRNNHESLAPPCQCTVDRTSVIAASLQPGSWRDTSATLTSTNFIKALASPANPHITPGKQSLPSFQHVAQHPLNSDKLLSSPTEFHCCILLSPLQPINVCCAGIFLIEWIQAVIKCAVQTNTIRDFPAVLKGHGPLWRDGSTEGCSFNLSKACKLNWCL